MGIEGMEVKEGMQVYLQDKSGNPVPATVMAIGEETLSMDCNHPLAGKTLEFDITIIETGLEPDQHHCGGGCDCESGSCDH